MTRKRVLFVDDELKILKALRRVLYPIQEEWEVLFAESGMEALSVVAQGHVDVLVTDMRMPGMNGLTLLKESKRLYPRTIRVMLTGQPSRDLFCEVLTVCHYFLWKPVDNQDLITLLTGIAEMDSVLRDEHLLSLIGGMASLPSLPTIYTRLTMMLENEDGDASAIAAVVGEDMAMTAQVLKMVNSAYFGLSRKFSSLEEAVAYLGIDILRQLVLVHHLFSECSGSAICKFHLEGLWAHSLCTAKLAKEICDSNHQIPNIGYNAYVSGLLHDIGKLVLIRHLPYKYGQILEKCGHDHWQIDCEEQMLGTNHASIGGYLASLWGLPHMVAQVLTCHHHDMASEDSARLYPVTEAVWHADRICNGFREKSEKYHHLFENHCGSSQPQPTRWR